MKRTGKSRGEGEDQEDGGGDGAEGAEEEDNRHAHLPRLLVVPKKVEKPL